MNKTFPFKIGADPEFLMFHGSRALHASAVIDSFLKNKHIRKLSMGYFIPDNGEIGWDGADSTGEFRPLPSNKPAELTRRLGRLIEIMHANIPLLDYTTLSIGAPIGGHLHLDVPTNLNIPPTTEGNTPKTLTSNRIEKLISTFIMPIIASEHRISSVGRLRAGYGKPDDLRWAMRGENNLQQTIEVRGLSSEWITSEAIAYATIAYIGVVWHEILKNNALLIRQPAILKTKNQITTIQETMFSDFILVEEAFMRGMRALIKKFELYKEFQTEVDFILSPKAVIKMKKASGWNLSDGWHFGNGKKQPLKRELLSQRKVAARLKSSRLASIENAFDIPFNEDYNVALFANAITQRIAAFSWKLQHEYLLFGLKKGIEGYAVMHMANGHFFSIPQNSNHDATDTTCKRMAKRFNEKILERLRIDPKTGRVNPKPENQILIGIPYDIRAENNVKSLISLVIDIEKAGIMMFKPLSEFADPVGQRKEREDNEAQKMDDILQEHAREANTLLTQQDIVLINEQSAL